MHIFEINQLKEFPKFSVVVGDGNEEERTGIQQHREFEQQAKNFIEEKYGEHVSIGHSEIIFQEWSGCIWIELTPKTSGIIEMISEEYGLTIQR